MTTQHTSGPLSVVHGTADAFGARYQVSTNDHVTAFCYTHEDATLYAAAPELLTACEAALDFLKATYPLDHGKEKIGLLWQKIEQALNKAKGETR